jgi:glutathione S-transferase
MQLYFTPHTCSLAIVIAAVEAGLELDLVEVDIMQTPHRLKDGSDYAAINPRNYVPMLVLDNGETLTEVAVILQYLADLAPQTGLAAPNGGAARLRLQETLNFIASELHKSFSPWLFHPEVGEAAQAYARTIATSRLALLDDRLGRQAFVAGDRLTIADAYLFVMVFWSGFTNIPLAPFANLGAWFARMKTRPSVIEALRLHSGKAAAAA